jgi:cysteine desulfurase
MGSLPVYMDNNATTRVDPRVLEAMLPFFTEDYGNAASRHHIFGRRAADAVEEARTKIADLIGAQPREIVFTSGATESNNLAIKGMAATCKTRVNHIVSTRIEHHAVLDSCKRLERAGFEVTYLPVDREGLVDPAELEAALTPSTFLVSVMAANNEIGTLQPLAAIGKICKARQIFFHCDGVQAAGKVALDIEDLGIDLLSLTAQKMYGPKGIGALYIRSRNPRVRPELQIDGGGHERGLRSGTLPVPSIVGFGVACELCRAEMTAEALRLQTLRERLYQGIISQLDEVSLNGHRTLRLAGNLNLAFAHVEGEAVMVGMKNVAISSGSACTSANPEPSYVLKALGLSDELARGSLRFGLGRFNTEEEVDYVIGEVVRVVRQLRALSPDYALGR